MKIYPNVPCELYVQSHGSSFLMVLKGQEADIQAVFNGLYNHGATADGTELCPTELKFTEQTKTTALFWSSPKQMLKFFRNLFYFRNVDEWERKLHRRHNAWKRHIGGIRCNVSYAQAEESYAITQLEQLKEHSSVRISPYKQSGFVPCFSVGKGSAERPDVDFKDLVLSHAFRSNDGTEKVEKELAS